MNTYIIAYDVDTTVDKPKTPSQVYSDIREVIEAFSVVGQLTESCWLIQSNQSHVAIRDLLLQVARSCDRILVVQSACVAAWNNLISSSDWVRQNI